MIRTENQMKNLLNGFFVSLFVPLDVLLELVDLMSHIGAFGAAVQTVMGMRLPVLSQLVSKQNIRERKYSMN